MPKSVDVSELFPFFSLIHMHIKDVLRLLLQRRKILTVSKIFATTAIICRNEKQNPANFFSTVCGKNMRQFTNIIISVEGFHAAFIHCPIGYASHGNQLVNSGSLGPLSSFFFLLSWYICWYHMCGLASSCSVMHNSFLLWPTSYFCFLDNHWLWNNQNGQNFPEQQHRET